jgi:hypothetical protein
MIFLRKMIALTLVSVLSRGAHAGVCMSTNPPVRDNNATNDRQVARDDSTLALCQGEGREVSETSSPSEEEIIVIPPSPAVGNAASRTQPPTSPGRQVSFLELPRTFDIGNSEEMLPSDPSSLKSSRSSSVEHMPSDEEEDKRYNPDILTYEERKEAAIAECKKSGVLDFHKVPLTDSIVDLLIDEDVIDHVRVLIISESALKGSLPDLCHLPKLEVLDASGAEITSTGTFPASIKEINLSGNHLEVVPNIVGLTHLEKLNLNDNKITRCDESVLAAIQEKKIKTDIEGNPGLSFPEEFLRSDISMFSADVSVAFGSSSDEFRDSLLIAGTLNQGRFPSFIPITLVEGMGYIYLGGRSTVEFEIVEALPVRPGCIINCAKEEPVKKENYEQQLGVAVNNIGIVDIEDEIFDFCQFTSLIHKALREKGAASVNCAKGVSRSASLVIAYLMQYQGMELKTALSYVQSYRKHICPNYGFMAQLMLLNRKLFGVNITENEIVTMAKGFYQKAHMENSTSEHEEFNEEACCDKLRAALRKLRDGTNS